MGRKKNLVGGGSQPQQDLELKPFCYYCDREFDSAKTLILHQRTKHFSCGECSLKFDTVTGLRVHMLNAYKKTMKEVPGAMPGRENPDIVVHGMEGLPKGLLEERTRKAMAERKEQEAQRAKETEERAKEVSRLRAERGGGDEAAASRAPEPPAPPPPEPLPPAPAAPAPQPLPQAPAPASASSTSPAPSPQAMMQNLSPAVRKLLAGESAGGNSAACLPGRVVPPALAGLHPAALQALAAAGALPSAAPVLGPGLGSLAAPPAAFLGGLACGATALGPSAAGAGLAAVPPGLAAVLPTAPGRPLGLAPPEKRMRLGVA